MGVAIGFGHDPAGDLLLLLISNGCPDFQQDQCSEPDHSYSTPYGAIFDGVTNPNTKLPEPDPVLAAEADPQKWFEESQKLAVDVGYAEAVKSGTSPVILDRNDETNAMTTARKQAALAAARLANLITATLQ
jgi:hypothetical protein